MEVYVIVMEFQFHLLNCSRSNFCVSGDIPSCPPALICSFFKLSVSSCRRGSFFLSPVVLKACFNEDDRLISFLHTVRTKEKL